MKTTTLALDFQARINVVAVLRNLGTLRLCTRIVEKIELSEEEKAQIGYVVVPHPSGGSYHLEPQRDSAGRKTSRSSWRKQASCGRCWSPAPSSSAPTFSGKLNRMYSALFQSCYPLRHDALPRVRTSRE